MENVYRLLAASAFMMLVFVETGDAVSCHVCNSKYDPGCDDPMKSDKYLRDCDTQPGTYGVNGTVETGFVKCRKMKQDLDGSIRVFRSCAKTGKSRCIDRTGTKSVKVTYCQCEGDGCNTASSLYQPSMILLLLSSLVFSIARVIKL